jgi:chemotaxis protein MotB
MAGGRGGNKGGKGGVIVIKREESGEAGHHGGAWKVAYADFVTAMMAFFLLMWLINATTEAQRRGLADYFSPSNAFSRNNSGNGEPFGGRTPNEDGEMASDKGQIAVLTGRVALQQDIEEDDDSDTVATKLTYHRDGPTDPSRANVDRGHAKPNAPPGQAEKEAHGVPGNNSPTGPVMNDKTAQTAAEKEEAALHKAGDQLRAAIAADPALASIAHQLAIDETPEGLRIQILDEDGQPMFATGSTDPNDRARLLLQKVVPILTKLSEPISIAGDTDAEPFHGNGRSNWDLSLERANATRHLLVDNGLDDARIRSVTGNADRDLLLPADPLAAANRRIAITVLRQAPAPQPAH